MSTAEFVPHAPVPMDQKLWAIQQWNDLADEQERGAALGIIDGNTARFNANLYRKTARSIEHEIETGEAVCVCCFKPFGRGSLHIGR